MPLLRPTGERSGWWTIGLAADGGALDDEPAVHWMSLEDAPALGPESPPTGGAGGRCAAGDLAWVSFQRRAGALAVLNAVTGEAALPSGTARGWVAEESQAAEGAAAPRIERRDDGVFGVFSHAWHAMETAVILRAKPGVADEASLQEGGSGSLLAAGGSVCFSVRSHSDSSSEPVWVGASLVLCGRRPSDAPGSCSAVPVWHASMFEEGVGAELSTLRLAVPPGLGARLRAAHGELRPTGKPRLLLLLRVAGRDSVYWAGHYGTRVAGAWVEIAGDAQSDDKEPRATLLASLPRPPARPTLAAALGAGPASLPLQASFSTGQGAGSGLWLRGKRVASAGSAWAAHALARSGPCLAWEGLSSAGVARCEAPPGASAHPLAWVQLESACEGNAAALCASDAIGPVLAQTRCAAPGDGPAGAWDGAHTVKLVCNRSAASGARATALARLFKIRKATASRTLVVRVRWWKGSASEPWAPVPVIDAAAGSGCWRMSFPSDVAAADTGCSLPRLRAVSVPATGSDAGCWASALWTLPASGEGAVHTLALALGTVGPARGSGAAEPAAALRLRVGQVSVAEGDAAAWPLQDQLEVCPTAAPTALSALGESAVAEACGQFAGQPRRHLGVALPGLAEEVGARRTRFEVWRVAPGASLSCVPDPSSPEVALAAVEDGTSVVAGVEALEGERVIVVSSSWRG